MEIPEIKVVVKLNEYHVYKNKEEIDLEDADYETLLQLMIICLTGEAKFRDDLDSRLSLFRKKIGIM